MLNADLCIKIWQRRGNSSYLLIFMSNIVESKHITERALHIFKRLVELYIRDGQPVGSKTLVEESALNLSTATVRNIMADLEEAGYLQSPHTSAGRIPTAQGYRLFVDSLLTVQPLEHSQVQQWQKELDPALSDARILVSKASHLLSHVTQLAGIVTLPRRERLTLRHVEFLPLSDNRLLVILVINDHEIQNRIIHTHRAYTQTELQQAGNYLTQHYAGKELVTIRAALLNALQADRRDIEDLLQVMVKTTEEVCADATSHDCVVAGQNNLLSLAEESGVQQLYALFDAFNQKRDLLHLLDQSIHAQGLQIFIGAEAGHQALDSCSVITAPYQIEGKNVGVLGVIGSTRMPYDRVIAAVDVTAKLLGVALSETNKLTV